MSREEIAKILTNPYGPEVDDLVAMCENEKPALGSEVEGEVKEMMNHFLKDEQKYC